MGQENRTGPFQLPQTPTLAEVITMAMRNLQLAMRTHTMCTVTAYHPIGTGAVPGSPRVDVSVDILAVVNDGGTEPSTLTPDPVRVQPPIQLVDIPVHFPRTTSGYLTFPINKFDRGELHVQDRDLDAYLSKGLPADPVAMWTHTLAAAVFYPSIIHDLAPINVPTGADTAAVVLDGDEIKIGEGATQAAARTTDATGAAPSMATWITDVIAAFAALPVPIIVPPPTDFGIITGGSAKVKVE